MCYALLLHYGGIRDGQRAPCVCYAVLWQRRRALSQLQALSSPL